MKDGRLDAFFAGIGFATVVIGAVWGLPLWVIALNLLGAIACGGAAVWSNEAR